MARKITCILATIHPTILSLPTPFYFSPSPLLLTFLSFTLRSPRDGTLDLRNIGWASAMEYSWKVLGPWCPIMPALFSCLGTMFWFSLPLCLSKLLFPSIIHLAWLHSVLTSFGKCSHTHYFLLFLKMFSYLQLNVCMCVCFHESICIWVKVPLEASSWDAMQLWTIWHKTGTEQGPLKE